jgi:hypothetical protein
MTPELEVGEFESLEQPEGLDEAERDLLAEHEWEEPQQQESADDAEHEDETAVAADAVDVSSPDVPLGILTFSAPGWKSFKYQFTKDDLIWTARFINGEAGGVDNVENRSVIWLMFNRYAYFRNEIKGWGSFADFIRQYSTPLQPYLRSAGAANRHFKKCNETFSNCDYVSMAEKYGYYKGTKIPKGQLKQFLALQRRPWSSLSQVSRRLALQALRGEIPNPVGTASEFGDTAVYYKDRHGKKPSREQWVEFTKQYAAMKKWIWPSSTSPYDQFRKNVLFINGRARKFQEGSKVLPPSASPSQELEFDAEAWDASEMEHDAMPAMEYETHESLKSDSENSSDEEVRGNGGMARSGLAPAELLEFISSATREGFRDRASHQAAMDRIARRMLAAT